MNARSIFLCVAAAAACWPVAAGELHVAPVRPSTPPAALSPAQQKPREKTDAEIDEAARQHDAPLVDAQAVKAADKAAGAMTYKVTVIRGMQMRVEERPITYERDQLKEAADRKKAKVDAAKKKQVAKQRQARAARTAAQVRAGL